VIISSLRAPIALLREEARARRFFAAHAQSSLGTGAAYVAVVVLAYDRFRSPWAITLILLAEFLPGVALGPVLGAVADRWSRRGCAVLADVVRAAAFVGLGLVDGFAATFVLAFAGGTATALYRPAVFAALPGLVRRERSPAATALYASITDLGYMVGPALAALALLFSSAEVLLIVNGLTFAASAVVLARLDFGHRPVSADDAGPGARSLLRSVSEGMRAARSLPAVPTVVLGTGAVLLFAGLINVGELLLAEGELGAGGAGYSVLVAAYGACFTLGSLAGSRGGSVNQLSRHFAAGMLLNGIGILASGLAPTFGIAVLTFGVSGLGNGLVVVHGRLLIQSVVPDALMGRVFALSDSLAAAGLSVAFLLGGAVASLLGVRELFFVAGAGVLVTWAASALTLARARSLAPTSS
jgi:MFS family permease